MMKIDGLDLSAGTLDGVALSPEQAERLRALQVAVEAAEAAETVFKRPEIQAKIREALNAKYASADALDAAYEALGRARQAAILPAFGVEDPFHAVAKAAGVQAGYHLPDEVYSALLMQIQRAQNADPAVIAAQAEVDRCEEIDDAAEAALNVWPQQEAEYAVSATRNRLLDMLSRVRRVRAYAHVPAIPVNPLYARILQGEWPAELCGKGGNK